MYEEHNVNLFGKIRFWCKTCGVGYRHNSSLFAHKRKMKCGKFGRIKTFETKLPPTSISKNVNLREKNPILARRAHRESGLQDNCLRVSTGI